MYVLAQYNFKVILQSFCLAFTQKVVASNRPEFEVCLFKTKFQTDFVG